MKTHDMMVGLVMFLLSSSLSGQQIRECAPVLNTSLFNGRDLNSWVFFIKDQPVDPSSVFMVKDAAIRITGNPFGYMRTREQFADYKLHLEWRWPIEATNSGVFIHAQEPDAQWPQCIEVQLKAGDAGDFICVAGASMNERTDENNRIIRKMNESNELPVGGWNTMEVICRGNTIEVYINGTLQNKGTGLTVAKGSICLQSEGKDIEFRNIYLTRLE
ncbi:MAG: DUF1080 domain-containing protein [Bacteroidales bacterium]|nr:DUF1080 domain-containing protein [Bacteroidales bacterium]